MIEKADEIIIFGYSLPDTDFYAKWLFFHAGWYLRKVFIVDRKEKEGWLKSRFISIFKIGSDKKNTAVFYTVEDFLKEMEVLL